MIEFIDLYKSYQTNKVQFQALQNINFQIQSGEIFGIVGKSGAGKSTLLRCINLLEKPTTGQVLVDGEDLSTLSEKELRAQRRKIGMIFQNFNLLSHSTVYQNIALPLQVAGVKKAEIEARVENLLEMVELSDKRNHYPDQLSGGQKQRVAIARALANDPSILLCDEATSALDSETTLSILNLLKKINQKYNVTIVLITHQIEVVRAICKRVAILSQGAVVELTQKEEFFHRPKSPEARALVFSHAYSEFKEGIG